MAIKPLLARCQTAVIEHESARDLHESALDLQLYLVGFLPAVATVGCY